MLSSLHIENIAVIKRADMEFGPGLNVLTGETGAGKSIVIDSLEAILGARVTRELVRRGADGAAVTAVFRAGAEVDCWLRENGLEAEDELIVSRRISGDGKSSCRINGVPAPAAQLRELGALLIDIHGQNDGRRLLDEERHRDFLDAFGGCRGRQEEYAAAYGAWRATSREIESLSMDEREKERRSEELRHSIAELERARLRSGEYDELEARRGLLRNAEKLTEALEEAYAALYGGEENAVSLSAGAESSARRAAQYAPELAAAAEDIAAARAALEDAAETLRDFRDGLDFSPGEYDALEERLAELRRLCKKYGRGEDELIAYLDECRTRLDGLEYSGDMLRKLEKRLEKERQAVLAAGAELTAARRAAAAELSRRIERQLHELSMPSARFVAAVEPLENGRGFDSSGCDTVRFLMSANAGMEPGRISRIASGGELSRIMLAMKNVFAETDSVETMVFDEIDTGVSGVAAQRVGEKLGRLSRSRQVLCVTHLPQIAAMADRHFRILKSESGGETVTEVDELDRSGRLRELARLTGGDVVTDTTLKSAAEQLDAAAAYKKGEC